MSEEWDEKNKKDDSKVVTQVTEKKPESTVEWKTPDVSEKPKASSLFITVEEYANILTEAQRASLREQRISRFPNLYDIRGFNEDIISKHPMVEMSNEARLYTSLFEENFKATVRKAKKKKVTH